MSIPKHQTIISICFFLGVNLLQCFRTVNADRWVILDAQIDVFLNTEAKRTLVGEVLIEQLELLHLEGLLQDLVSL